MSCELVSTAPRHEPLIHPFPSGNLRVELENVAMCNLALERSYLVNNDSEQTR
jgi:hypothetical protein